MTMQYDERTFLLFFFKGEEVDSYTSRVVETREVSLKDIPDSAYAYQFCQNKYVPGRGWKRVNKFPEVFINAQIIDGED